jgi:DNA-directed RNA polymerase subunit RPC12/RpoP
VGNVIEKYGLDRLQRKGIELSFKCPYCSSARLWMKQKEDLDYWHGVVCPKCHSRIVLDSLTLVALREGAPPQQAPPEGGTVHA